MNPLSPKEAVKEHSWSRTASAGKRVQPKKLKNGRYLENNYILSFIGVAPADDPQIVVYIAVDNPRGTVQFGGVVAAPIVGNIMEDSLRAMGVKPRKNQIEKETVWTDPVMVEVPDVVGLSKRVANPAHRP